MMKKNNYIFELIQKDRFFEIVTCLMGLSIVLINYCIIDRGLIFSDEGFYLCLLRDLPTESGAFRFHLLFHNVLNDNILAIRIVTYTISLLSTVFFAYCVYQFQRVRLKLSHGFFYCLGVVLLGRLLIQSIFTVNYILLNSIISFFGVGFLLLYAAHRKYVYVLLCSFALSFLYASQITCLICMPIMLATVILVSDSKKRAFIYFCTGGLLFLVYYFLFVETPAEVLHYLQSQTNATVAKGSNKYGVIFLVKWLFATSLLLVKYGIIAYLIYRMTKVVNNANIKKGIKNAVMTCVVIVLFFYANKYMLPNTWNSSFTNVFSLPNLGVYWILLISIYLFQKNNIKNIRDYITLIPIMFMPACLSFGSDIPFYIRSQAFIALITPIIFIFLCPSYKQRLISLLCFALVWINSLSSLTGANWYGDKLSDQNQKMSTIGINQNIKLSKERLNEITFAKRYIKEGDFCVTSSDCWGIVEFVKLKPLTYAFDLPDASDIIQIVNSQINQTPQKSVFVFVSHKDKIDRNELKKIGNNDATVIQGDIFDIYKYN